MRRRLLATALVTAALLSTACGDQAPVPTAPPPPLEPSFSHLPPTASQIRDQIEALFRDDLPQPLTNMSQEDYALSQFAKVEQAMNAYNASTPKDLSKLKEARARAFALIVYTFLKLHKGELEGGKTEENKVKAVALAASLLRFVDFTNVPDLTTYAAAPSDNRVAGILTSAGGSLVPASGDFFLTAPPGAVPAGVTAFAVGARVATPVLLAGGAALPVAVAWSVTFSDGRTEFASDAFLGACVAAEGSQFHPRPSNTGYLAPQEQDEDPATQRVVMARLLSNGQAQPAVVATQGELIDAGVPPTSCEDTPESVAQASGPRDSGVLALGRKGLEAAFNSIGRLLSPKPAYAFTLLLGCRTRTTSTWFPFDQYPPVDVVTVTPSASQVTFAQPVTLTTTLTDPYGFALSTAERGVSYVSSDPSIAGVSAAGVVTAKKAGTVTITATSQGISGTASITFDPVEVLVFHDVSGGPDFAAKAAAANFTVATRTAAQWALMETTDFAAFDVIAIPTIAVSSSAITTLTTTNTKWGPAITGNMVLAGLHADEEIHDDDEGATIFLRNALRFAAAAGGTGFVSLTDRRVSTTASLNSYSWVPTTGPFAGLTSVGGKSTDKLSITNTGHPVMAGLTNDLLSGWGQSLHSYFSNPGGFGIVAVTDPTSTNGGSPAGSAAVLVWPKP